MSSNDADQDPSSLPIQLKDFYYTLFSILRINERLGLS